MTTLRPAGTAPLVVPTSPARASLRAPLVLGGVALAGAVALVGWDPHTHHVPLCPFHAATGLWCPLCGGLRTVHDVLTGHLAAAVTDNVLVLVGLPLVALWWLTWVAGARAGRVGAPGVLPPALGRSPAARRWALAAAVVLVLAFTVLRNLPVGATLAP